MNNLSSPAANTPARSTSDALAPIALGPGEGEALWFLGVLATVLGPPGIPV